MSPPEKLSHLIAVWDLIVVALATIVGTLVGWAIKLLREIKTGVSGVETQLRTVNGRLSRTEQWTDDHDALCDERARRFESDIKRLEARSGGQR